MSNVQRSTRKAVTTAGLNGVFQCLDILSGRTLNLRGVIGSYWHIDVQAETKSDWDIILAITKNNPRDPRWPVRSVVITARNGTRFGCGLFTFNHAPVIYRAAFNPGPGDNAHICLHLHFSLLERPAGPNDQYRRGHQACLSAESGLVTSQPSSGSTSVSYQVEVISGPVNIRAGAGTNHAIAGEGIRSPRRFQIDREQLGSDGSTTSLWGRIANDREFNGRWVALRLTHRIASTPVAPPPPPPVKNSNTYTVVGGDTLVRIGTKTGRRWQDIAAVNGIRDPYTIFTGQVLRLP